MRKDFCMRLLKETEAEIKKEKAAEMKKRKAEMWNKGAAEVLSVTATVAKNRLSRNFPKWEKKFRYYREKYNQNIFVMAGSTGFSICCTYEYFFKNVGKRVEILEGNVKAIRIKLEEANDKAKELKDELAPYTKRVDEVGVEVATLNEAFKSLEKVRTLKEAGLETKMNKLEKNAEIEKGKWVSKGEFAHYAKKMDKLTLEVASLRDARTRPFSRFVTITPLAAQQAAAIAEMRQEWRMQEWRKAWRV